MTLARHAVVVSPTSERVMVRPQMSFAEMSSDERTPPYSMNPGQGSTGGFQLGNSLPPGIFASAHNSACSEELATNRRRLFMAYAIATVLIPASAVVDVVHELMAPDATELGIALAIRAITTLVLGAVAARIRLLKVPTAGEIDFWVSALTPFLAVVVALLSLCVSGVHGPYTNALNLIVAGYAFVPRRWPKVVPSALCALTLFPLTYLVTGLVWDRAARLMHEPWFAVFLTLDTLLLAASIVIIGAAAHMLWALRREVFEARSVGRYRVEKRLGRGGMGEVWSAYDRTLKRKVALKIVRVDTPVPRALARFEREIRATIELTHPNTVRVLDVGVTDDGFSYYAMELLRGESLDKLLQREVHLEPSRAVHFTLQAARALAEAHARGIVHRDIKPENLFITKAGDEPDFVKVLDFGIARFHLQRDDDVGRVTEIGVVAGTMNYVAPEVIDGAEATPAADVYALGVVLFQMLTGTSPFGELDGSALLMAHLNNPPQHPSKFVNLPPGLEAVVLRCLAKVPQRRYADAKELVDALMALEFVSYRASSLPPMVSASGETALPGPDSAHSSRSGPIRLATTRSDGAPRVVAAHEPKRAL